MVGFSGIQIFFLRSFLGCSLLFKDLLGFVSAVVSLFKAFNSEVKKAILLGVETFKDVHCSLEELAFFDLLDNLEADGDLLSEVSAIWLHQEEFSDMHWETGIDGKLCFFGNLDWDAQGELLIAFNCKINWQNDFLESIRDVESIVLALE